MVWFSFFFGFVGFIFFSPPFIPLFPPPITFTLHTMYVCLFVYLFVCLYVLFATPTSYKLGGLATIYIQGLLPRSRKGKHNDMSLTFSLSLSLFVCLFLFKSHISFFQPNVTLCLDNSFAQNWKTSLLCTRQCLS